MSKLGFPEIFIISQTALPAMLYLPGMQSIRLPIRIAAYGISLMALFLWFNRRRASFRRHPAENWLLFALAYLAYMVFHPDTNGLTAGIAQACLYLAVFAPIFWAPDYVHSAARLNRLLWLLLICNGVNSIVGILQVYNPAVWMPKEFSQIMTQSAYGLGTVMYKGADGKMIIRPPGLFDSPGAVCGAGMMAGFLGLVLSFQTRKFWTRGIALGFSFAGTAVIYLTLVRTSLLVLIGMLVAYCVLLHFQGQHGRSIQLAMLAGGIGMAALTLATVFGGQSITSRFSTLVAERPTQLYYRSRGKQVERGFFELLPEYPLGAGLGRWGMMAYYFGRKGTDSNGLWAEIQFPAWIIDGGIVLLLCYCMALYKNSRREFEVARSDIDEQKRNLAGMIFAMNAGIIGLCFSFPVFCTQTGLQSWFLSGALHGVLTRDRKLGAAQEPGPANKPKLLYARGGRGK